MHKLSNIVTLQTNLIVGIALFFQRNIKYHQEVWKNVSVEILSKVQTAWHLVRLKPCPATGHLYTADSIFVLDFNTRGHFTGAKTLYFFPYDLCYYDYFILSSVYILPLVCSLHFTLSLHFTPGLQSAVCRLQSAVCSLHFTLTGRNYRAGAGT